MTGRRGAVLCGIVLTMLPLTPGRGTEEWADRFYPYRLRLALDEPATGRVAIALGPEECVAALREVSVDVTETDTFAFEKAVLVDPQTGQQVGGYRLACIGSSLVKDPAFGTLDAKGSPWFRCGGGAELSVRPAAAGDHAFSALWATQTNIANRKLVQKLQVVPGAFYVMGYRLYADVIDNCMVAGIYNPAKRLFAEEHRSYRNILPPPRTWTSYRVLYQPDVPDVELRIGLAFTGTCAAGDIGLQRVQWRLVADLTQPARKLDLYCVLRAGHRLPIPDEAMEVTGVPDAEMPIARVRPQALPLNASGIAIEQDGMRLWTVPTDLPLRADLLQGYDPGRSNATESAVLNLFRGGSATLLLAVNARTPQVIFTAPQSDLPLQPSVEQLAEIPVYDGPFPDAKLIERRLDARVPLNFRGAPPSSSGIHILALTFRATPDCRAGEFDGSLRFAVQSQRPQRVWFEVPIRLRIAAVTLKPMRHFGTVFGAVHFVTRYNLAWPGTSVAQFHNIADEGLHPPTVLSLTRPDLPEQQDSRLTPVQRLARRYFHCLLDHHLIPESMALYTPFTYDVVDSGKGKAPRLTNWDFTEYDKALDEFVIGRDVPWHMMFRTNGQLMHKLRLADNVTYSFKPPEGNKPWKQIPREAYLELIGDFFEAFAAHLDEEGILDRSMFVIDESDPSTYALMHDYVMAMKSRPYARRITVAHTTHKTSTYTRLGDDDRLLLDAVLDLPMPDNDDHFNHFEPEWNARMSPGKRPWVYYVETDHLNLLNAGLSTILPPLKLRHFGADGFYCWASFIWSLPYPKTEVEGPEFTSGPVVNPWLNPFYHHGPGVLSFFYPPEPRGPAPIGPDGRAPPILERIIPSYRLILMRDGIQDRALLEALETGQDDLGVPIEVNAAKLGLVREHLARLWADNPVQWYLSYHSYRAARALMFGLPCHAGGDPFGP